MQIRLNLNHPNIYIQILKNNIPCDIVQVPYNIFDQRFNSVFLNLREKKIEIHVRSIFLQGLFFVPIEALGDQFYSIKDRLKKIYCFAKSNEIDISSVCLGFVNKNKYIDKIIIGVDSLDNLKNNINNYRMINDLNIDYSPLETLSVIDEQIILPFNWEKK
jgi:aryl-alcohol dehydrogenase-like predicted oxidoreductase